MQGQEPERSEIDGIYRDLFSTEIRSIEYNAHPPEDILRSYLTGNLPSGWNDPEQQIEMLRSEDVSRDWYRNEVTAHLITCRACQRQIESVRESLAASPSILESIGSLITSISNQLIANPKPAIATMAVQAVIIVVLGVFVATGTFMGGGTGAATLNGISSLPEPSRAINSSDLVRDFGLADQAGQRQMAQQLSESTNIDWLPAITEMMGRTNDEEIVGYLSDGFNNTLGSINDALQQSIDQMNAYRIQSNRLAEFPDPTMIDNLQHNLASLNRTVRKLNLSADLDVLSCEPTRELLSLEAINPILDEFAAVLILDPQTEGKFEVQLPPLYTERAIPLLQQQAFLACSIY